MKLGLAIQTSRMFENYSEYTSSLSEKLKEHFGNKNYGEDLKALYIGIVTYDAQASAFFKPQKPKYFDQFKEQNVDGKILESEKKLEYEIWLNTETVLSTKNENEFLSYLFSEIINSLDVLDGIKKIKKFDKKSFKEDLEKFGKTLF